MAFFDTTTHVDFKTLARKRLPSYLFDFIEGGAFDENTLQANREDFKAIKLRKRVLTGIQPPDTATKLFNHTLSMPLIRAPVGFAGVYARRGEVQAAIAAKSRGIPYCHSSTSICSMEEVFEGTGTPFWYQFYPLKDRVISLELLSRALSIGIDTLVITVDLPSIGIRHRYQRSLASRSRINELLRHFNWVKNVRLFGGPLVLGDYVPYAKGLNSLSSMRKWLASQLIHDLNWEEIEWVRSVWPHKVIIKGLLDEEDVKEANKERVHAIVISNHGARHIDSVSSPISILPRLVDKADVPVLIDGGISNGLDMAKALALGAKACLIGRPWAFALAADGQNGVDKLLKRYQNELKSVMSQVGVSKIEDLNGIIAESFNF
ncbi:MAG: alpha-hydroxy-acid oxidizing protein [Parachlamydiaceae bacterium]